MRTAQKRRRLLESPTSRLTAPCVLSDQSTPIMGAAISARDVPAVVIVGQDPATHEVSELERVVDRVARDLGGLVARPHIAAVVAAAAATFANPPVRHFVPVLVERRVRQLLGV